MGRRRSGFDTRRDLLSKGSLLLAGSAALPALVAGSGAVRAGQAERGGLRVDPVYYPKRRFRPEVAIAGKLAVITGASRGNGRAIGESLTALGVNVIGTSRDPDSAPSPPPYPLLKLDVTDIGSVLAFAGALQAHPLVTSRGAIDILVNNAGRMVLGRIVPTSPADFPYYLQQRELGLRTDYLGHVTVTNALLPLLARQSYARIVFTTSIASYYTGAELEGGSYLDTYNAAKASLRGFANNLDAALRSAGSIVKVSTVAPYTMNTSLVQHPRPIYTQPVNASGLSDTDPVFNAVVTFLRQGLANGLPTSLVGETYAQLLQSADPPQNVVVGSDREPWATMGGNAVVEPQFLAENARSAVPLRPGGSR